MNTIILILTLLLIVYIVHLSPTLSKDFVHIFNNPIIRIGLIITLIVLGIHDPKCAILFLIALCLTYGFAQHKEMTERFIALTQ